MRYLEPRLVQVAVSVCILQLKDIAGDLRDGLPLRFAEWMKLVTPHRLNVAEGHWSKILANHSHNRISFRWYTLLADGSILLVSFAPNKAKQPSNSA